MASNKNASSGAQEANIPVGPCSQVKRIFRKPSSIRSALNAGSITAAGARPNSTAKARPSPRRKAGAQKGNDAGTKT